MRQTVARALRESCNIPFESFFLATHLGNGKFAYFSGPRPISEDDIRAIFKRDKFLQFQNRPSSSKFEALVRVHVDGLVLTSSKAGALHRHTRMMTMPMEVTLTTPLLSPTVSGGSLEAENG